jgi:hypothetical protein
MDRYIILNFFLLFLLLVSCGQVGVITGGPVDNRAPLPIMDEVNPPMASLNTFPAVIEIPFDEFIALNKPSENIRVVPEDVKLEPIIRNKTLLLKKVEGQGDWQPNTTYAIYLKRTVKDITESNDSIVSFVFSTGSYIDSLMTQVKVIDAFSGEPLKDINVGLYANPITSDTADVSPRYVSITDEDGIAIFDYLMKAPFYAYAFYDGNKNNQLDPSEKRGRLKEMIIGETKLNKDTINEIRLMPPQPSKELMVQSNEVESPPFWSLGFGQPVKENIEFSFPLDKEPLGQKWSKKGDSVVFIYGPSLPSDRYSLYYDFKGSRDTLNKKFIIKELREFDYETNLVRGVLNVDDTLTLTLNQAVEEINTDNISVLGLKAGDSVQQEVEFSAVRSFPNEFQIVHAREYDSVYIQFLPESIKGFDFPIEDTLFIDYAIQQQKQVGKIILSLDTIPPQGVFQLINNKNEVIKEATKLNQRTITFDNVQPGKYTFSYILDTNNDGRWSTGSIFTEEEAEYVLFFKDALNVRANWDVKGDLEFMPLLNNIGLFLPQEEESKKN